MRIGIGYDVHPLEKGRPLYIGGIEIPSAVGSVGHSDGDVLLHAICDALLGAAGLGDLGKYFPSSDEKFRGIRSTELLEKVVDNLKVHNYKVNNIDATVILQAPRLAQFTEKMREIVSEIVGVSSRDISVKATTTDGLDAVGEGRGIAAQAVVTIEETNGSSSLCS
ncbi:MAG TPA: 2-C-methyl-D-erythritol 2,4-cyclodiphosphate synthase [Bdellovibrionota bacterium]|nr:2-C-methyl-D-erythritol 2,4-cyclodiphosphate synthase [Bdellovibrionota bacterium]